MVRLNPTLLKIPLLTLAFFLLCLPSPLWAEETKIPGVVATVDGEPVYYREILPDDTYFYELSFWVREGHKPVSKEDREKIKNEINTGIMVTLRHKIETKIRDRWIKGQGIEVSESDLDEFWEPFRLQTETLLTKEWEKKLKKFRDKQKPLLSAVTAIYEEGKDKDQVFEEYKKATSYQGKRAQWEMEIYSYRKKWTRDYLISRNNFTREDFLKEDREGHRHYVLDLKIKAKVHETLAKNDPAVKKWFEKNPLKLKYESLDQLQKELFLYPKDPMGDKRYRFWRDLYRKADIKILDPKYEKVLVYIREEVLD